MQFLPTSCSYGKTKVSGSDRRSSDMGATQELACFGAGCFWSVEVAFRNIDGVLDAVVGYTGGMQKNPTYEEVCTEQTGHAEVVQVTFDPSKVSYEALVMVFFACHDPTQLNRQGPDFGSQYRSAVFYHSQEQRAVAQGVKDQLAQSGEFSSPIVTAIELLSTFYKAEDYHQRYLEKRGLASCRI
jgi:peptide-methionine (S)-S-oxide reductase